MIADKQRNRTISDHSLDGAIITKGNTIEKPSVELHPIGEHDDHDVVRSRANSHLQYFGSAVQIDSGSQHELHKRVKTEVSRGLEGNVQCCSIVITYDVHNSNMECW